jgi:class 3 adenylate cyclase
MGADEEGTLDRLKSHRRELIDPKIAEHHGRIVKTTGDGAGHASRRINNSRKNWASITSRAALG